MQEFIWLFPFLKPILTQQTQRWPPTMFGVKLLNFKHIIFMKNEMIMAEFKTIEFNGLQELNQEELVNTDGGGWLADAVAEVVHYVKCDCNRPVEQYHNAMRSSNYGGIR